MQTIVRRRQDCRVRVFFKPEPFLPHATVSTEDHISILCEVSSRRPEPSALTKGWQPCASAAGRRVPLPLHCRLSLKRRFDRRLRGRGIVAPVLGQPEHHPAVMSLAQALNE